MAVGPSPEDLNLWPGLQSLTPREADVLACHGVAFPDRFGMIDLSPALARTRIRTEFAGCLTPGSRCYLMHRCRLACGLEAMHFQGLHYGHVHGRLQGFRDKALSDLAGNAFHAYSCAASMLTALICAAWGSSKVREASLLLRPPPESVLEQTPCSEDEDEDSILDSLWPAC